MEVQNQGDTGEDPTCLFLVWLPAILSIPWLAAAPLFISASDITWSSSLYVFVSLLPYKAPRSLDLDPTLIQNDLNVITSAKTLVANKFTFMDAGVKSSAYLLAGHSSTHNTCQTSLIRLLRSWHEL